jgi:hypothetical protein
MECINHVRVVDVELDMDLGFKLNVLQEMHCRMQLGSRHGLNEIRRNPAEHASDLSFGGI